MFDRGIVMNMLEFIIEYLDFCVDFILCGIVKEHQGLPAVYILITFQVLKLIQANFTSFRSDFFVLMI